jgi:hypothetical protein
MLMILQLIIHEPRAPRAWVGVSFRQVLRDMFLPANYPRSVSPGEYDM